MFYKTIGVMVILLLLLSSSSAREKSDFKTISINTGSSCCCLDKAGNVDCSEIEEPDISDITRLIDNLYISHEELCCLEEADVNGSGDYPDISDITAIIDHLYLSHKEPGDCSSIIDKCCFGQRSPGLTARIFYEEILSLNKVPHGQLAISPDCSEIFWSGIVNGGPWETIYFTYFNGVNFTTPEIASFALPDGDDHGPSFSCDGTKIFFTSIRPTPGYPGNPEGVWYVVRTDSGWSDPIPIEVTLDTLWYVMNPSVSRNGNLYFSAVQRGGFYPRIYCCKYVNGEYSEPEIIPGMINITPDLMDACVDPDEKYILFQSMSVPGYEGNSDLYISYLKPDSTWGEPINLGIAINTKHFERFPSISPDGLHLFFIRAVGTIYITANPKYYWINAEILNQLK